MEFLSGPFLTSLATIAVIDLMLAGDNALVIALAARNLPERQRQRAIVWGVVGAIVVRAVMTLMVVRLLEIPGMLLVGGAVLVWIAYKLLIPPAEASACPVRAVGFWAAMGTIVMADAVMGLDNVLAVAGAARGSFVLVLFGLALSVPIVAWGSGWLLRGIERYPAVIYLGSGVLAWTAANMIFSEPLVRDYFAAAKPHRVLLLHLLVVGGVLFAGLARTNPKYKEYRIPATLGTAIAIVVMTFGN